MLRWEPIVRIMLSRGASGLENFMKLQWKILFLTGPGIPEARMSNGLFCHLYPRSNPLSSTLIKLIAQSLAFFLSCSARICRRDSMSPTDKLLLQQMQIRFCTCARASHEQCLVHIWPQIDPLRWQTQAVRACIAAALLQRGSHA